MSKFMCINVLRLPFKSRSDIYRIPCQLNTAICQLSYQNHKNIMTSQCL